MKWEDRGAAQGIGVVGYPIELSESKSADKRFKSFRSEGSKASQIFPKLLQILIRPEFPSADAKESQDDSRGCQFFAEHKNEILSNPLSQRVFKVTGSPKRRVKHGIKVTPVKQRIRVRTETRRGRVPVFLLFSKYINC